MTKDLAHSLDFVYIYYIDYLRYRTIHITLCYILFAINYILVAADEYNLSIRFYLDNMWYEGEKINFDLIK